MGKGFLRGISVACLLEVTPSSAPRWDESPAPTLPFAGAASLETLWGLFIVVKASPPVASVQLRCQRVSREPRAAQIKGAEAASGLGTCRGLVGAVPELSQAAEHPCTLRAARTPLSLHPLWLRLTPHTASALPMTSGRALLVGFRGARSGLSEPPGLDGRMILLLITPRGLVSRQMCPSYKFGVFFKHHCERHGLLLAPMTS